MNNARKQTPRRENRKSGNQSLIPRALASRISAVERKLVSNPKWINPTYTQMAPSITNAAPYTFCVNAVVQGTSENTRIGAKIRMTSFEANLSVSNTSTAQIDVVSAYRILVIQEKTCLGSNISPTQVFLDSPAYPHSMRDHTNRDASRFIFLYDSGVQFVYAPTSALASPFQNFGTFPSIRNHHIKFKTDIVASMERANNGNVGDIDTNGVSIVILTDSTTANAVQMYGAYATEFLDV